MSFHSTESLVNKIYENKQIHQDDNTIIPIIIFSKNINNWINNLDGQEILLNLVQRSNLYVDEIHISSEKYNKNPLNNDRSNIIKNRTYIAIYLATQYKDWMNSCPKLTISEELETKLFDTLRK